MRDFVLVFKTLYKNANSSSKDEDGKKRLSTGIKFVISISPLIILVSAMIAFLSVGLNNIGEFSLLVTALVAVTQILVLFLSMFSIVSTLYESKDTPFLNTLPLKPLSVFFAKFAMTYVNALAISAVVLLPTVLTGAIAFNVANGRMFYGFYPLFFVILALAPILPLFVVVVLSMPVVWLGSYFRGKPTLKSVLTILFYVVLMCAYMVVVYYMNTTGFGQNGNVEMSQGMLGSLGTLANVFYPDKAIVNFCLGIDAVKNFRHIRRHNGGYDCDYAVAVVTVLQKNQHEKVGKRTNGGVQKRVFETKQRRRITDEKGYKIHHAQQLACDDFDCKLAYGADFYRSYVLYFQLQG